MELAQENLITWRAQQLLINRIAVQLIYTRTFLIKY